MKSLNKIIVFPLVIGSLLLTGCFRQSQYEISTLDKHNLNCIYKDYFTHNVYNLDSAPTIGKAKLLVIPIWFSDSATYLNASEKQTVLQDIRKAYFGTNEETGWRSVKTFYEQESHGALTLEGVVTDWYSPSNSSSYYYPEEAGAKRTQELVESAVEWYRPLSGDNLKSFDADNNGVLDGVMLIYASPDYQTMDNNNAANMWAYCYWMQEGTPDKNNPIANQYFWASYDFMYGSGGPGSSYGGDTSRCNIDTHTYIHEMGHVFGLEDYYDYSNQFNPGAGFSMQDINVGGHDPYSVMALGWANPYVPTENCSIKIKDFQSSGDLVVLSNKFADSPFDEYLILELYSPTGLNEFDSQYAYKTRYPQGPKYYGIRLWHIDARLLYLRSIDETFSASRISNTIEEGRKYHHLCSNTYYGDKGRDYISKLGKSYADYNIMQLIRNNIGEDYEPTSLLNSLDLFYASDTFSMSRFRRQFVNSGKLNTNQSLNWSFRVNDIKDGEATLTFYKG